MHWNCARHDKHISGTDGHPRSAMPRMFAVKNAAVAPSVVPRRLEFRRNSHEIKDLWKSGVQVGSEGLDGPVRQNDRLARARLEIGLTNLAYNTRRFVKKSRYWRCPSVKWTPFTGPRERELKV